MLHARRNSKEVASLAIPVVDIPSVSITAAAMNYAANFSKRERSVRVKSLAGVYTAASIKIFCQQIPQPIFSI